MTKKAILTDDTQIGWQEDCEMWGEGTQESGTERCDIPMGRHQTKHTLQQGIFTDKMRAFYFTKMPGEVRLDMKGKLFFPTRRSLLLAAQVARQLKNRWNEKFKQFGH